MNCHIRLSSATKTSPGNGEPGPGGWDTHPNAKYPLFIYHGHVPAHVEEDAAARAPQLLGHVSSTLPELNQLELVLGAKTRAGQQWDIWETVFSPVGADLKSWRC